MICNKCNCELPEDSEYCQYCGYKIEKLVIDDKNIATNEPLSSEKSKNADTFIRTISAILAILVSLFLIVAMNIQDAERNVYEKTSPTEVYLVLLFAFIGDFIINAFVKEEKIFEILSFDSIVLAIIVTITVINGAIFSKTYIYNGIVSNYISSEYVEYINFIWMFMAIILIAIKFYVFIKSINKKVKSSFWIKEKYFEQIEKLERYMNRGLITEEEFEEEKTKILSKIKK